MNFFVVDACAFIAYLRKEQGFDKVVELFEHADKGSCRISMHVINLTEVYYDFYRASNKTIADNILTDIAILPLEIINTVSMDMVKMAGHFKATYKISFADSFVLATAKINNAKIVTSDHHEFDAIERSGDVGFEWIR